MENPKEQSANYQVQQIKPKDYLIKYAASQEEAKLISCLQVSNPIGGGSKETLNLMIDVCAKWRWMAGISVQNQDENDIAGELVLISKFIIANYPDLTIEEINLAIDLSLTDKLNTDVRAFNVFSPMYVSRILNAYVDYKRKNVHNVISRKFQIEDKEQSKQQPTPAEKMESMIGLIHYFHEQYQSKGEIKDYFSTLYNFFRRIGLLSPDKEMVNEAMEYGKKKAAESQEKDLGSILRNEGRDRDKMIKGYARNYCVQKLFDTLNLENIEKSIEVKHFE